ncbi:MAG: hypothetical protein GWN62_37410, partial [Aliifodinibius sp.]|nr:hypothetical protein [Fodinibius sp.]
MKPKIPVMYSFDTERLKPGEYQMLVQIRSKNSPFELERSNRFTVYQSPTDLRFKTYDKLLKELKLIASE